MDWVLDAWEAVPEDLIQRGMQHLIVDFAVKSDPSPRPVVAPIAPPPPTEAQQSAALSLLDTMEGQDIQRVDEPDEEGEDESGSDVSDSSEETEEQHTELSICMLCERPLRFPNVVKCNFCQISFHAGCVSFNSAGKCQLCP